MTDPSKALIVDNLNAHELRTVVYVHELECSNKKTLVTLRESVVSSNLTASDILYCLTVKELRWFLQMFEMPSGGRKDELIDRIVGEIESNPNTFLVPLVDDDDDDDDDEINHGQSIENHIEESGVDRASVGLDSEDEKIEIVPTISIKPWVLRAFEIFLSAGLAKGVIQEEILERGSCYACSQHHHRRWLKLSNGPRHYPCISSGKVVYETRLGEMEVCDVSIWMKDHHLSNEQVHLIDKAEGTGEFDEESFSKSVADHRGFLKKFFSKTNSEVQVSPLPPFVTFVVKGR